MADTVEYRDIPGYPGYRAGSDGSVWTAWKKGAAGKGAGRGKTRLYISSEWVRIRAKCRLGEYPMVGLKRPSVKMVSLPLHRIVLLAFVGPRPDGAVCRHLDGNKHNNALCNLVYGTQKENAQDAIRHGTFAHGETHCCAKLNSDSVRAIRAEVLAGTTLDVLAARYQVNRNAIWLAATRKTWKHVEDAA